MRNLATQFDGIEQVLFQAPVGIVVLSTDGCFVRVNSAYRALTGRDDAWLLGRPFTDALASDPEEARVHLRAALNGAPSEEPPTWRARHRGRDTEVETELTFRVARDEEERARFVVGYVRDATVDRDAPVLDETEETFQRAFSHAPVGMAIIDSSMRFRRVNTAMARMLGRSPDDLAGRPYRDHIHPADHADFDQRVARIDHLDLEHGHVERRLVDSEGRVVHVSIGAARVTCGAQKLFFCVFMNLTEQRSAETERVQLQEQMLHTERLRTLGQIASGIAHEVNNPVAIAVGGVDLARRHIKAIHEAMRNGDLTTVRKNVDRLEASLRYCEDGSARLVKVARKLSAFSALHGGRIEPVDVNDLVGRAIDVVQNDLRHRAELVVELGELPPLVAHPARLLQAVTNLLVNAAQAIEGPPAENRIRVTTRVAGPEVEIVVSDTGVGMSRVVQERIFEPFYTTRGRTEGGGLGLTVVNDVVRQHRGRMEVESAPGEGSRFVLYLPFANGLGPPPGSVPEPSARARVLVVDDEPFILAIVAEILDAEHEVVTAGGGPEALTLLATDTRFDVLLCDLMMPSVDGVDVHQFLLKHAPALASRTVFVTGGAVTPRTEQYVVNRAMPLLLKPFTVDEVRAALATALVTKATAPA